MAVYGGPYSVSRRQKTTLGYDIDFHWELGIKHTGVRLDTPAFSAEQVRFIHRHWDQLNNDKFYSANEIDKLIESEAPLNDR